MHRSDSFFVNWADFPAPVRMEDGTIAVHWLKRIGPSSFDYRVEVALSGDGGASWSGPLVPHDDRSFAQHGFVSMLPSDATTMAIVWLDGRAYGADGNGYGSAPDAMQLRGTTLTDDGILGRDVAIDLRACSCCQTGLAAAGNGTILAAYRDRTEDEIRDISVVRWTEGGWERPVQVHDDGWEISGCPVNGPAIAADGDEVAVSWFTGADDVAAVKVAFSGDAGRSFEAPVRIDHGNPVGHVDIELLGDGSALVSWVEWAEGNEVLLLCRVRRDTGCLAEEVLTTNTSRASMNFPRMARVGRDIFIAWTQPNGATDSIEIRRASLAEEG